MTVTCEAVDGSGNRATTSFTVTRRETDIEQPPDIGQIGSGTVVLGLGGFVPGTPIVGLVFSEPRVLGASTADDKRRRGDDVDAAGRPPARPTSHRDDRPACSRWPHRTRRPRRDRQVGRDRRTDRCRTDRRRTADTDDDTGGDEHAASHGRPGSEPDADRRPAGHRIGLVTAVVVGPSLAGCRNRRPDQRASPTDRSGQGRNTNAVSRDMWSCPRVG